MQRRNLFFLMHFLIVSASIALVLPASGDKLYKREVFSGDGHGREEHGSISWTDCSGKPSGPFKKPPYWFSQGDDCKPLPASYFGLHSENGIYIALNLERVREFFPDASDKDTYSFEQEKDGTIDVSQNGKKVSFPPELSSALTFVETIKASSGGLFVSPTPELQAELLDTQSGQGQDALKAMRLFKGRLPQRALQDGALLGFAFEDYDSATKLIAEGLRVSPNNKQLLLARGLVDYSRGLYSTAFRDFSDVASMSLADTHLVEALRVNRALTVLQTGQTQNAENSLKESADAYQKIGAKDRTLYLTSLVADVSRDRGLLQEADAILDRAGVFAKDLGPTEEARLLRQRAQVVFLRGNTREAESLVEQASTIHGQAGSTLDLAEDFELAGEIKAELRSFPEALVPLEKARKAFVDAHYLRGQASNRLMAGEVFMDRGDYEESHRMVEQAAELFKELQDARGAGEVEVTRGTLILRELSAKRPPPEEIQGSLAEALKHFKNALDTFEKIDYKRGIADAHKGICVHLMLTAPEQELSEAAKYCEKALTEYKEIDFPRGVGDAYGNLGIISRLRKDWDASLKQLEIALQTHKQIGFKLGIGRQLFNIGRTHLDMGDPRQGAEYFRSAKKIFEETDASSELSMAQHFLEQASK